MHWQETDFSRGVEGEREGLLKKQNKPKHLHAAQICWASQV